MADAEVKKLKAAAGQCKAQFTRFERFLEKEKTQKTSTDDILKMRLQSLDKAMNEYRKTQLQINILLELTDDVDFLEDDLEERYYVICEEVNKLVKSAECKIKHGTTRLPHLDIPVYSGQDVTKYLSFMELFIAVIGRDQELAPVQKLCYLRKYLSGEASTLIESLPLVDTSYEEALQLLKNRYDNKCILVTSHVNNILDYPVIVKGTAHNLRELVSNVRQHLGALRNMEQPVDQWDMILLPILLRKLDQFSSRAFHAERNKGQQSLGPNNPTLLKTKFGYVVAGEVTDNACVMSKYLFTNTSISTVMHCMPHNQEESLNDLMERFWEVETLPPVPAKEASLPMDVSTMQVPEAELCEAAFKSSVQLINGHTFGAHHDDNFLNLLCRCRGFLMGAQSSTADNPSHFEFSLCSKRLIAATLNTMSYCLYEEVRPNCGNGIVEEEEACDCGLPVRCVYSDPCCTPRTGGAEHFEEGYEHNG